MQQVQILEMTMMLVIQVKLVTNLRLLDVISLKFDLQLYLNV